MTRAMMLGLVFVVGCADASAQDPTEITIADLPCSSGPAAAAEAWESTQWPPMDPACVWTRFDGRESVRVEHELGRVPRSVIVYLSFQEDGRSSNVAPGDATRIVSVDETVVEVRNGTEQDFFLKMVLQ